MNRCGRFALVAILLLALAWGRTARAGEGVPDGPVFIRLSPVSFSVIGPTNKIDREVSIMLNLELEPGKTEQMYDAYRRQMEDAFLMTLTTLYEDEGLKGRVSAEEIKARLMAASEQVTGPGFVHAVLIVSVGERPHH